LKKIAIISTKLKGIDGVSIEADKWAGAFKRIGFEPIYIAGNFARENEELFFTVEEMDYYHPEIVKIRKAAFNEITLNGKKDLIELRKNIEAVKNTIKNKLLHILKENNIKFLSIENALAIPLNVPLGIALGELISEQEIRAITRHHDLYWERKQFSSSNIEDILIKYFPPDFDKIEHVVINTIAKKSLYSRKGIKAAYIPNIFDFKMLDKTSNSYRDLRKLLNIDREDYLFLQPTRIIKRKNIERSIELADRLSKAADKKVHLFISGKPEKNEMEYFYRIIDLARERKINLILSSSFNNGCDDFVKEDIFSKHNIFDFYKACDLVTLPSDIEGFGNPVLEACAFKKPLFVNSYPVLSDILSKGFDFIVINKEVDDSCVKRILNILTDSKLRLKMLEKNYRIAKNYYSIEFLIKELKKIMNMKYIS